VQRIKASNLNRGLVGAWCPSVAGNGLLLPDLSGYGNHGTLTNMNAADWVGTDRGRALDFDGSDDYVNIPSWASSTLGSASFVISLWCKTVAPSDTFRIAGSRVFPNAGYILFQSGGTFRFLTDSGPADGALSIDSGFSVTSGWHHLVGGRNNSNQVRIYVDGMERGVSYTESNSLTSSATLHIGGVDEQFHYSGQVDDIRIYNRALSPSEIKQLYEGGPGYGLRQERKRSRFQVQGFNVGRYRRQQLIGSGVY